MNYGHVIDTKRRFIYQVYDGHFSLDDIIACTRRLWADSSYSKSYHGVADLSRMSVDQNIGNLQDYIAFLKKAPSTSDVRWATIVTSPWLTAGAMIYRTSMAGRHPIEVFSTWASASRFLQLDLSAPPPVAYFPVRAPEAHPPVH